MNNPHYPDEAEGRTTYFAFDWVGGGYNNVYARDKYDAIFLADAYFGGGTANLKVCEDSVREITDIKAYHNSRPYWD